MSNLHPIMQNALAPFVAKAHRAKHTPGMWTANKLDSGRYSIISRSEEQHICETVYEGAEHEANARLIAAAPKLLEALKQIAILPGGTIGTALTLAKETARTAIAEAEGR